MGESSKNFATKKHVENALVLFIKVLDGNIKGCQKKISQLPLHQVMVLLQDQIISKILKYNKDLIAVV